jgi:hypothetical protein
MKLRDLDRWTADALAQKFGVSAAVIGKLIRED